MKPTLTKSLSGLLTLAAIFFANEAFAADDYPYPSASTSGVDPWSFYYRQCTSFVAWRMNRDAGSTSSPYYFSDYMESGHWGDAYNWAANATTLGFIVDTTPEVGAIAQWNATEVPTLGHVAYVEQVNGDGSVNVSEYNYSSAYNYDTRNSIRPPRFIHLRKFVSGNRIQANSSVNVRSTPGGTSVTTEPAGNLGGITGGPSGQAYGGVFYKWYQVSWDNGYSGWSIEEALTKTAGNAPPAPVATAATSVTSSGFTANWNSSSGATGYRIDVFDQQHVRQLCPRPSGRGYW